jgi:hypothetical protein
MMDTSSNQFQVGRCADRVVIAAPELRPLTQEEALNLAAWLVALSDPDGSKFQVVLDEIRGL